MYGLTVVPCASLLCVLNIRQTEAKVDAILSDFVQLRQEAGEDATQVLLQVMPLLMPWLVLTALTKSNAVLKAYQEVPHVCNEPI